MPPVPIQFLCFSVGLAFSAPFSWWAFHVGKRSVRRVVNIDGLVQRWAATAPISTVVENPLPPEYTQVKPGQFVRLRWGMLERRQWRALLTTTATNQLCGEYFERGEKPGQYNYTRDLLINRGVARWKYPGNRQGGWELTKSMGRAIADYLGMALPQRPPPLPNAYALSQVHTHIHSEKETK